jgi:hypothetical protein
VRKCRANGPFEFIPLSEARTSYPALPLPPSTIAVAEPAKSAIDSLYASSVSPDLARSPGSMLLNMAAARCWAAKGDKGRGAEHLAKVRAGGPDVAGNSASDGAQRAADEGGKPASLMWGAEE